MGNCQQRRVSANVYLLFQPWQPIFRRRENLFGGGRLLARRDPDSARTFEPALSKPTVIPLRDSENGQTGETSWDGETGPRLVTVNGRLTVEYTAYEYSDYTSNALAGRLSLSVTGQISREDYQHRILAMHLAYIAIGAPLVSYRDGGRCCPSFVW